MSSFAPKLGSGSKSAVGRKRRHLRVRKKVSGTVLRPRLVVNRSARHVFAQLVDDVQGVTLASASTMESDLRSADSDKTAKARKVGNELAARAQKVGIDTVVFDRGGHKYHGRDAAHA
jgi:large subunit ribosomal protein L18